MAALERPGSKQDREAEETRIGWRMAGLGMQVASEVAAGALLGWLFDLWRGSGNVGIIAGSLIGITVGLWSLIRNSLKLNRELDRKAPTVGRGRPIQPDEPWREQDTLENENEHDVANWNRTDDDQHRDAQQRAK